MRVKKFLNDAAVDSITLGLKSFACIGNTPPHDHPHVYLEMGDEDEILCPYCATQYQFDPLFEDTETDPPGCLFDGP